MARSFSRGTSDNIAYGHYGALDGASQVALSMWVYPTASTSYDTWLTQSDGSNGVTLQHRTTAAGRVFVSARNASITPSGYTTSTTALTVNQWNHLVVQFDGTQVTAADRVTVYCNGAAFALTLAGTWPTTLGATAADLKLGTDWTGRLADVAIWNGVVLSPSEIAQLANCRAPDVVRPRGLMFYADLRKGTSDAIAKLPGTVSGTTLIDHPDRIIRPTAVRRRLYVDLGGGGTTYNESIAVAADASLTHAHTLTVSEALAMAVDATMSPVGPLTAAAALGLDADATIAKVSALTAGSGIALGADAAVSPVAALSASPAMSLDADVSLAKSTAVAAVEAIALAADATLSKATTLVAAISLALAADASLSATDGTSSTYDEALALSADASLTPTGALIASLVADYAADAGLSAATSATIGEAIGLDLAGALEHVTQAAVAESIALGLTAVLQLAATASGDVTYTILRVAAETLRSARAQNDALRSAHVTGETLQ